MCNRKTIWLAVLLAIICGLSLGPHGFGYAADLSLGLGAAVVPDYEGSDDYEAAPVPYAEVSWDNGMYVELMGNRLKANLVPDSQFKAGPMFRYRRSRGSVDDDKVDDMKNVPAAKELGAFGAMEIDRWVFSMDAVQDVGSGHEGWLATFSGRYRWPLGQRWLMFLGASSTYASDDYMDAYFGVNGRDAARSGLKQYKADAGFKDVSFDVGANYVMTERWSVRGLVRYTRLLGDAADSPVTDDRGSENQFLGGFLVVYSFGKPKAPTSTIEPYQY